MAWLQKDPSGNFHISFRFGERKFKRSLRTKKEKDANARLARLEENVRLVESGRIELPTDADVPTFLLSDGKLNGKPVVQRSLTLEELLDSFFANLPNGSLEETTLRGMQVHKRHLIRVLGAKFPVQLLTLAHLQNYVSERSKKAGLRGRKVGAITINKEVVTFQGIWNWAAQMGKLDGNFPRNGLRFPKTVEKPPFQTWEEIENQIEIGNLSENERAELWDCLFLSLEQIDELLTYVKGAAKHPFIHPMFVMAAHTGARRSELLRSKVHDFDGDTVLIHERKRVRGKQTTRRVPMSSMLQQVIKVWLDNHPGGSFTFCLDTISRSKKCRSGPQPITGSEATDHFKRTLKDSRWKVIRGWHCLRHSFCSNCARKAVDQRIIDSTVGHTTEEMSRRYQHLFPNSQKDALRLVFG